MHAIAQTFKDVEDLLNKNAKQAIETLFVAIPMRSFFR